MELVACPMETPEYLATVHDRLILGKRSDDNDYGGAKTLATHLASVPIVRD